MKRFSVILIAQFVVIAAAAFFGSWAFARWHAAPAKPASDEMSWFQSQLGLEAQQSAKLEKFHADFQAEQAKLCERHCAKRFELGELIKESDSITPRVEQLTKELAELEAQSQRLTIQHIFEVGKQLDAAQRAQFVNKVYDQICSSCPMGSHRPGPDKQASCGASGCECCLTSAPNQTEDPPPIASMPDPQPRMSLLPVHTSAVAGAGLHPRSEHAVPASQPRSSLPLFVLLSIFLI